ncbi:hypothetical protein [Paludisphaera sp.]|uniref:hypothetical protein n=1 Tax=Paludisphaera sp. TaxID=2017432 RepID=UPI00301CB5EF
MSSDREPAVDEVFENPGPGGGSARYFFLGGLALVAIAIASFLLAISVPSGQLSLHATTTLPLIVATGLFARAFALRGLPDRIVVGPDGMEIETRRGARKHPWSEIGSAARVNVLNSQKTCLRVTDTDGKAIVRVDESFPDYERLAALVESYVDAKPDDTSARIMARKARRMALFTFAAGCFLALAAVFIALDTRERQRADGLLAAKGVPGEAEIVRRFTAPNGVTKRIEYRVAGSGVKNVEVHPAIWDLLEGAETIVVVYVPDEPDISRLDFGEVRDGDFTKSPRGGYLLAALGGLMALFMLGYSPIAWMGYDLAFDDKRRTWKVTRHGRVVWSSGKGDAGTGR